MDELGPARGPDTPAGAGGAPHPDLGFPLAEAVEGRARLLVPDMARIAPGAYYTHAPVFYNPHMRLNRDVSILVYRAFLGGGGSVLDLLAATGVRAVRAALEAGASRVVACDANPSAVALVRANAERNGVSSAVEAVEGDARAVLLRREWFDVVDVDPFGCPTTFLQEVPIAIGRRRGLVGVTATDGAVLCGVHPEACLRKYASRPLKTEYCHELALRILAYASALPLLREDLAPRPVLAHAAIHFFRVYLEVRRGKRRADAATEHIGYASHCSSCGWRRAGPDREPACPCCGGRTAWAGPLWTGPLSDRHLISKALEGEGCEGQARRLLERLAAEPDIPLYYDVHGLASAMSSDVPRTARVIGLLQEAGFAAGPTHLTGSGVKTDAPPDAVREAMRRALGGA